MSVRFSSCLTFLLCIWSGAAQCASADLISKPLRENYQPEVEVSGNVIVGVMSTTAGASLVSNQLSVLASGLRQSTDICLRATSSDGIYTSRNHYRLPANASGAIHLPYVTTIKALTEYTGADIAISASAGDCETSSTDYYLVTPLQPTASADTRIYLNSFGATDVFYQIEGSDRAPEACEYIEEGRRTTYDFFCSLTPSADPDTDAIEVDIIRERFGREQPGVQLRLIGAGQ